MKKQSPLTNIPTAPKTFSGQWLTFSHMANHYRKLVNVKPRVDTGITRSNHINVSSPKRTRSRVKANRNGIPYSSSETINDARAGRASAVYAKRYKTSADNHGNCRQQRLCSLLSPNDSFNAESTCSDGYQVVFGPSSIKSSMDALISDQDADLDTILAEPKLSSISIGEKIRKFLNHIHQQEEMSQKPKLAKRPPPPTHTNPQMATSGPQASRPLAVVRDGRGVGDPPKAFRQQKDSPQCSRHSRCFTPYKVSESETSKRVTQSPKQSFRTESVPTSASTNLSRIAQSSAKSGQKASPKKNKSPLLPAKSPLLHDFNAFQGLLSAFGRKRTSSFARAERASLINSSNVKRFSQPQTSPRSVSVGTIHGSEELTEDLPEPSPRLLSRSSQPKPSQDQSNSAWLQHKVEHGVVKINNAYFSLSSPKPERSQSVQQTSPVTSDSSVQKSTLGSQTNGIGPNLPPNKDSSRDSACGFSSGESRITTRESTPEKKSRRLLEAELKEPGFQKRNSANSHGPLNCKYKSSLSTVASSINQDHNSSGSQLDSLSDSPSSSPRLYGKGRGRGFSSVKSKRSLDNSRKLEEKYVHFLAAVTDDIVKKGIYTNKGIKNVFNAHLIKHAHLDMEKMLTLLERLRIDMGVPKEDSLNQLDFGYGSVKYSAGPYFYKGTGSPPEEVLNPDTGQGGSSSNESDPGGRGGTYVKNSRIPSFETSEVSDDDLRREELLPSSSKHNRRSSLRSTQSEDHNHNLLGQKTIAGEL